MNRLEKEYLIHDIVATYIQWYCRIRGVRVHPVWRDLYSDRLSNPRFKIYTYTPTYVCVCELKVRDNWNRIVQERTLSYEEMSNTINQTKLLTKVATAIADEFDIYDQKRYLNSFYGLFAFHHPVNMSIDELASYDTKRHNDQIDAYAAAVEALKRYSGGYTTPREVTVSYNPTAEMFCQRMREYFEENLSKLYPSNLLTKNYVLDGDWKDSFAVMPRNVGYTSAMQQMDAFRRQYLGCYEDPIISKLKEDVYKMNKRRMGVMPEDALIIFDNGQSATIKVKYIENRCESLSSAMELELSGYYNNSGNLNGELQNILDGWKAALQPGLKPKKIIFNDPTTLVIWEDDTKTMVKCQEGEVFDREKGLALCFMKKAMGNKGKFNDTVKKAIAEHDAALEEKELKWVKKLLAKKIASYVETPVLDGLDYETERWNIKFDYDVDNVTIQILLEDKRNKRFCRTETVAEVLQGFNKDGIKYLAASMMNGLKEAPADETT